MLDPESVITDRLRAIDASGIRRVFDLAADLENPVNLSIGQPDFDVPEPIKQAAAQAMQAGENKYTQTQGTGELRDKIARYLKREFPETLQANGTADEQTDGTLPDDTGLLVTSGVSGGLLLALLACAGPGDEVLIPDPYFVMYRHLVTLAGATPVFVDTYPDFQLTPDRIERCITPRTKLLLANSPSNPTGAVASPDLCRQWVELAHKHDILLVSDEIYDEFCYEKTIGADGTERCPSPLTHSRHLLLLRGFSKSYAMTGWRLGYALGPQPIVDQMTKLQQYSFVCAPSTTQAGGLAALDVDMSEHVDHYQRKRDRVVEKLSPHYELTTPGGAFYAFPKVPEHLSMTGAQFVEKAVAQGLLIIPGNVFSERDTHFRLSYACHDDMLEQGLDMLVDLARG